MMDVRHCIEKLRSEGFTDRRIERVFGMDERFLSRSHHLNTADEASTALLKVLASFPFMIQVAEAGYDTEAMTLDEMIAEYQRCQDNSHIWYYDCVTNYASWLKRKINRLKGLQ